MSPSTSPAAGVGEPAGRIGVALIGLLQRRQSQDSGLTGLVAGGAGDGEGACHVGPQGGHAQGESQEDGLPGGRARTAGQLPAQQGGGRR
ncbi:hypothetical protein [Streptomyces sp. MMG1533]|uniref:hypothetical protein n=1 Tax=Streptomyces sp. MMG1533 TaxID=1415546 RepID=UPI000A52EDBD|nr:hypothetical protein [Streptomyces sp. MMG1533]